jgi:hypothetical protein
MSVSVLAQGSVDGGSSSVPSLTMTLPASLADGDVLLTLITAERATSTPSAPTGLSNASTTLSNTANTTMAWYAGYTVLGTEDSSTDITSTMSGGLSRRMAGGFIVLRGCDLATIVTAVGSYTENGTGVVTATTGSVTPTVNDSMMVALMASCSNVSPYARTQSVNAPYSQQFFDISTAAASTNAIVHGASQLLSGQSGVLTAGATFNDTTAPTPTKFAWIGFTVAIGPSSFWFPGVPLVTPEQAPMRAVW